MIKCPNCGKELPDGARFCDECGSIINMPAQQSAPQAIPQPAPQAAPQVEMPQESAPQAAPEMPQAPYIPYNGMQPQPASQAAPQSTPFCQNCGAPSTGTPFCQNCGAPMMPANNGAKGGKKKTAKKVKAASGKKGGKKGLIIGLIAAVLVIAIAIVAILLFGKKGGKKNGDLPSSVFYIMDSEIYYTDFGKDGGYQITDRLIANSDFLDKDDLYDARTELGNYFQLTPNGKMFIYGDRIDTSDDGFSIYIRKVGKKDSGAVKMDSNVRDFYISSNSNLVTYEKYNAGSVSIYQYDIKKGEKTKLASDVDEWIVSDDGKTIIFSNYEGALYALHVGGEKEKLDSDVYNFGYFTDDLKTVWYLKDSSLYTRELGKDKQKIDSDVAYVTCVQEDGSFYYVKKVEEEYSVAQVTLDDMASQDTNMAEPVAPDYPSSSDYTSDDAYQKAVEAYNEAYEAYYEKLILYWNKGSREAMRENPSQETITFSSNTLFYYNGSEKTKVMDNMGSLMDYCLDASYIVVSAYPSVQDAAATYSQLSDFSASTVQWAVEDNQYEQKTLYYVNGADAQKLAIEDVRTVVLSEDGKTMYYISEVNDETYAGTLAKLKYGETSGTTVDEDVYCYSIRALDGSIYYFKDVNREKYTGDMYCDGKDVDFDVYVYGLNYVSDIDTMFYYADYSSNRSEGTLKMLKNGKITVVSEDVVQYIPMADGSVVYLYDYSFNSYTGEAYMFKNGKKTKLADDVICLLQ